MEEKKQTKSRERDDRITGGVIVLGIGVVFLLTNLDVLPHLGRSWPAFLIVVGLAIIVGSMFGKRKSLRAVCRGAGKGTVKNGVGFRGSIYPLDVLSLFDRVETQDCGK